MSDLVERLRAGSTALREDRKFSAIAMSEAATQLEAKDELIAELAHLLSVAKSGWETDTSPDTIWRELRDEALSKVLGN